MFRRKSILLLVILIAVVGAGCRKNKTVNPIANVDSKQPDKVLFDRAMNSIQHNKFDTARLTLQTLINTYPDSEYIARAKLAVGDSWYAEGTGAALQQAEVEYKDFETFFPNMPEAAEAQLKVAGIHFKQMEKPDRDYTHAKRAEDEYRQLIQQFPDSKLVPEAKARLLQVQEVLAEREYRIGHFYLMRESYPAAIARLRSLVDAYPLYSQADDALLALGQAYEGEINMIRSQRMVEAQKANVINELTNKAAEAYSKIITRYPAMDRVEEAKSRLTALNRPVPTPTAEAIAQNKAEAASRGTTGMMGTLMLNFKKRPDMAAATKVGEPTMEDPKQTNAPEVLKDVIKSASKDIDGKATVETVKDGSGSKESDPVPRSDAGDKPKSADQNSTSTSSTSGTNGETAAPPPNQINDAATDSSSSKTSSATADDNKTDDKNANESTSKPKKKKGFKKLIPF